MLHMTDCRTMPINLSLQQLLGAPFARASFRYSEMVRRSRIFRKCNDLCAECSVAVNLMAIGWALRLS